VDDDGTQRFMNGQQNIPCAATPGPMGFGLWSQPCAMRDCGGPGEAQKENAAVAYFLALQ
jgi:hypothetical protein